MAGWNVTFFRYPFSLVPILLGFVLILFHFKKTKTHKKIHIFTTALKIKYIIYSVRLYNTNIIHTRRLIQVVLTLNNTKTHEIFTARDLRVKTVRYWLAAGTHSHRHAQIVYITREYTTHINIVKVYMCSCAIMCIYNTV